jgi:hypothetical protein
VHGVRVIHLEPDVAVERSPQLQAAIAHDRQRFFARNAWLTAESSSPCSGSTRPDSGAIA